MDRKDGFCVTSDVFFNLGRIDINGIILDISENRHCTCKHNRIGCCQERNRRGHSLNPRLQTGNLTSQMQCCSTTRYRDCIFRTAVCSKRFLKFFNLGALRNPIGFKDFDYVFGPSYKGISLATLTCEGLNELYGMDKRYMYDRKEEKDYGDLSADKVIVGASYFKQGQRILIVDDTITTGTTKVESVEKLKLLGNHEVVGFIIAVDRQEKMGDTDNIEENGAVQYLEEELGLKVFPIQNIQKIYGLIKDSLDEDMRRLWVDYYSMYGTEKLE